MHPDLFGFGLDDPCGRYMHWSARDEHACEVDDARLRSLAAQMRAGAEARAAADVVAEAEAILRRADTPGDAP